MLVQCRTIFLLVIRVAILSQPEGRLDPHFWKRPLWNWWISPLSIIGWESPWEKIQKYIGWKILWIVGSKTLEPLQSLQGFAEHRLEEGTLYCKKVSWETSTLFDELSKRSDGKLFICQEQESLYTSLHQLKRLFTATTFSQQEEVIDSEKRHVQKFQQIFPRCFPRWLPDFPLPIPTCFVSFKKTCPHCVVFSWPCPTSSFSSPFHHRYPVGTQLPSDSNKIHLKWTVQMPISMTRQKPPIQWTNQKYPPKIPIIKWNTNNYPAGN